MWKATPQLRGYEASLSGRLRRQGSKRCLKLALHRSGYCCVSVRGRTYLVHRLVLAAFGGTSGLAVHHINGQKTDNRLRNLEYITASRNAARGYRKGAKKSDRPWPAPGAAWCAIPSAPGYLASSCGCVRREVKEASHGLPLKPWKNNSGYLLVSLSYYPRKQNSLVHRLVAEAFMGLCPAGMVVHHRNGNREDNSIANLAYVTAGENMRLAEAARTGRTRRGLTHSQLDDEKVEMIKALLAAGFGSTQIAGHLLLPYSTVAEIKRGTTWKHVRVREAHERELRAIQL